MTPQIVIDTLQSLAIALLTVVMVLLAMAQRNSR